MKIKKFLGKGILISILFSTQVMLGGEIDVKRNSFEDFYKTYLLNGTEPSTVVLNGNLAPTPKNVPMAKLRANGVVEKIDSVVIENEIGKLEKEEYRYSDQGYMTKYTNFVYENGRWNARLGQEFEFDAKGRQTAIILYEGFIPETSSWIIGGKNKYTYDENGFVYQVITSDLSNNTWVERSKLELENNKQGLVTEGIAYSWRNGDWAPTNKTIYDYDEDGDLILNEQSNWVNEDWVNFKKQILIDDPDHILVENYEWVNSAWIGTNRHELRFILAEDGKRIGETYEGLSDFANNQFRVNLEVRSTYDENNRLILQEAGKLDIESTQAELRPHSIHRFTYGAVTEFEEFEEFKDVAVQREGILETYNPNGSTTRDLKDFEVCIAEDIVARTVYLWNEATGKWRGQTRATYIPGTASNPVFTNTDYLWSSINEDWYPRLQTIETKTSIFGKGQEMIGKILNPAYNQIDNTIEPLINVNRFTYEYGEDNVLTRQENFSWDSNTNNWQAKDGEVQEFDYSISIDQIYGPISLIQDPLFFVSKPTYAHQLSAYNGEFFNAKTKTYYYSPVKGTNIPAIQVNDNAVAYFVDNTLTVNTPEIETVSVYSLSGNLLFSAVKAEGSISFNVPSLIQGVYIVKGSTSWTSKLVKH